MQLFNEKCLVNKLEKILRKEFGTNLVFREFSAGYGIADLVLAPDFSFDKNVVNRIPLTSFNCLRLLLSLDNNAEYQMSDFVKIFNQLTVNEIKKYLKQLIVNGYVLKLDNNKFCKNSATELFNPIKKIVAVEAKLFDHNGGLTQAKRYQYFADESYLAILKEYERNINFEEFNKFNIGLILFDNDTNTIEIKHPTKTNDNFENMFGIFAKEMMLSKFANVSF